METLSQLPYCLFCFFSTEGSYQAYCKYREHVWSNTTKCAFEARDFYVILTLGNLHLACNIIGPYLTWPLCFKSSIMG